jgi:hypothetical protein
MKKIIALSAIATLLTVSSAGQSVRRALFIGNSYVFVNNLPQITADIARSAGDSLFFNISAPGGYTLRQHSEDNNTLGKIRSGYWDFVVLQEQSLLTAFPDDSVKQEVVPFVHFLDSVIHVYNRHCKTMFYMTWGRKDGDSEDCQWCPPVCTYAGMDTLVRQRYLMLAGLIHAPVSPVGAVWKYIRQTYPEIVLYQNDGSHPSEAGSYAAACCFYTSIFRKSPFSIRYDYRLTPAEAGKIRTAVKKVVSDNLKFWQNQ